MPRGLTGAMLGSTCIAAAGLLAASAWSAPPPAAAPVGGVCPAWVTAPTVRPHLPSPATTSVAPHGQTTTVPAPTGTGATTAGSTATTTTATTTPAAATTPAATSPATATTGGLKATVLVRAPAPAVAYVAHSVAVGPTSAVLLGSASGTTPGDATVAEYWLTGAAPQCAAVAAPHGAAAGSVQVEVVRLRPGSRYDFRLATETAVGRSFSATARFATLPAGLIADGVTIGHVQVGRLSAAAALDLIDQAVAAPLRFSYAGAAWRIPPAVAGLRTDASSLVTQALKAMPGQVLAAPALGVDAPALATYIASLGKRFGHTATQANVALQGVHAVVVPGRHGVAIESSLMAGLIGRQLETGSRAILPLAVKTTQPGSAGVEKAVVVRLGSQTLTAYLNGRPVLHTLVTTGRPALPTPIGSFSVQYRASPYTFISPWPPGNPFWYPPTPVTWVMYFYDNDFLHDDPGEPTGAYGAGSEYGPYASHGCVHVPHDAMAFLYNWLPVGARVVVSQT